MIQIVHLPIYFEDDRKEVVSILSGEPFFDTVDLYGMSLSID
jgi:hypothetical protein